MKLSAPLSFLIAVTALTGNAHGSPIVISTDFSELIVIGTDTFEATSGSVLFTTNAVSYSDWLSPIIAGDLATDPTLPTQVQSTASLIPEVSELQFLTEQLGGGAPGELLTGGDYIVLGGIGPAFPGTTGDIGVDVGYALEAAGGAGYSIVSTTPSTVGQVSYTTGALAPDGDVVEGTVNIDVYDIDYVERPVAAVPEPSSLALLGVGLLALIPRARRFASATLRGAAWCIDRVGMGAVNRDRSDWGRPVTATGLRRALVSGRSAALGASIFADVAVRVRVSLFRSASPRSH